MTDEHLFALLESENDLSLFAQFAGVLARGDIPRNASEVTRRGRVNALRKAKGSVRGFFFYLWAALCAAWLHTRSLNRLALERSIQRSSSIANTCWV